MEILVAEAEVGRLRPLDGTPRSSPGRHRRVRGHPTHRSTAHARTAIEGPIIEARGLGRTFESQGRVVDAVRDVNFTVSSGEIVGFLGPNGAGKTTTMRLLTTLLPATAGEALIAGSSLRRDPERVRRHIGYVAQGGGTRGESRVVEELVLQARLHEMTASQARERSGELCALLDLVDQADSMTKTLSGGQRRRLDIALGLVHRPAVLFLDEPTTGLDPHSRTAMWDNVRRLREEVGTTVFLTTHYLDEADALCDRVLLMDRGTIAEAGTPEELKRRIAVDIVTIELNGDLGNAWRALDRHDGVDGMTIDGLTMRLAVDHGDRALPGLIRALDAAGVGIASVQLAQPTLDDVFLTLTKGPAQQRRLAPAAA